MGNETLPYGRASVWEMKRSLMVAPRYGKQTLPYGRASVWETNAPLWSCVGMANETLPYGRASVNTILGAKAGGIELW